MTTPPTEVNPCCTLGHLYISTLVVRCPHLESYRIVVSVWRDSDRDEPTLIRRFEETAGPFDTGEYIRRRVMELSGWATEILMTTAY